MSVTDISFKPRGACEQRRCSVPPWLSLSITLLFVNDTSVEARKRAHVFCCDLPAYEISPGSSGEVCTSQPLNKVFLSEMKRNCLRDGWRHRWNSVGLELWLITFTQDGRVCLQRRKGIQYIQWDYMQQRILEAQRFDVSRMIWNTYWTLSPTCKRDVQQTCSRWFDEFVFESSSLQ